MRVKILLADNHKIMRDTLRALLEKQDGMDVVAEAENGKNAVLLARKLKPDVVIMDINMADLPGIEVTRQIISDSPGLKIIAISIYADRQFVEGMLEAGASGFLLKDCAFEELGQAIRSVVADKNYLSSRIAAVYFDL